MQYAIIIMHLWWWKWLFFFATNIYFSRVAECSDFSQTSVKAEKIQALSNSVS